MCSSCMLRMSRTTTISVCVCGAFPVDAFNWVECIDYPRISPGDTRDTKSTSKYKWNEEVKGKPPFEPFR